MARVSSGAGRVVEGDLGASTYQHKIERSAQTAHESKDIPDHARGMLQPRRVLGVGPGRRGEDQRGVGESSEADVESGDFLPTDAKDHHSV
jgi:hypothetical protein